MAASCTLLFFLDAPRASGRNLRNGEDWFRSSSSVPPFTAPAQPGTPLGFGKWAWAQPARTPVSIGSCFDGGAGTDLVVQSVDASQTLSDTQLTGIGTNTMSGLERARLTGGRSSCNA
jgi:hypothetical protein